MQDLNEVFEKIQEQKEIRKEINREYKDALTQHAGYEDLKEEIKALRDKKKAMEEYVQEEMGERFEKFEKAKNEITELEQVLTDIAMTSLMDGKSINIKDKNDIEYEPTYKIMFKKIK